MLVEGGTQQQLAFIYNDAFVENAVLIDASGSPFSGALTYRPSEGRLYAGEVPAGVQVKGNALLTSSALTAEGFRQGLLALGDWNNYIVTLCVFLFALSTMISWSYYGDRCVTYLLGNRYVMAYRVVYVVFVFIGAWAGLKVVWDFGDLALGLMTLPNLVAVVILVPKVIDATRDYFSRLRTHP
ncbi:MAG: alanine:cation symporter family protein [Myxococcota bacterium]